MNYKSIYFPMLETRKTFKGTHDLPVKVGAQGASKMSALDALRER